MLRFILIYFYVSSRLGIPAQQQTSLAIIIYKKMSD